MSLDTIYASLNGALHNGTVTLGGSVPAGIADVLARLGLDGGSPSLTVTSATLSLGPAAVILSGTATFRSRQWAVTLTGESSGERDRLTLRLQGSGIPVTLRELFGQQPPSRIANADGVMSLADSVLDPLTVANPALVAETAEPLAHIRGSLRIADSPLTRYTGFLLADRFDLDGTVAFPAVGLPKLELKATAPSAKIGLLGAIPGVVEGSGIVLSNQGVDTEPPRVGDPLSTVAFFADITNPMRTRLTAPLLRNDGLWPLRLTFPEDSEPLSGGLAAVASFFGGNLDLLDLPPGIDLLNNFYLSSVELGVNPGIGGGLPSLVYSSFAITSKEPWNPPVPFVTIKKLGTQWLFRWPKGKQPLIVTGSVFGTFTFGAKGEKPGWDLDAVAYLPSFDVWISSHDPLTIPIGDAIGQFFSLQPADTPGNLTVSRIEILAQTAAKTFTGLLQVEGDWKIPVNRVTFALEQITFRVMVTSDLVVGSLEGLTSIRITTAGGQQLTKAVFYVRAEYPGAGNWVFSGGLSDGTLPLADFVSGLLGLPDPPAWVGGIRLTELDLRYDTGPGNPYKAHGKATAEWDITDALGIRLALTAAATVERKKKSGSENAVRAIAAPMSVDGDMIYSGDFAGSFQINQVKVTAGLNFDDSTKTYFFRVDWNEVYIKAIAADTTTKRSGKHKIITITLGGVTIGSLVERLINLLNPNLNYHLESPWSVLNDIDLSRFSLVLDPTESRIELNFRVDLSLAFIRVDTVGVVYDRSAGDASVYFKLTGQFLDKKYDDATPLTWDAVNDAPPEVPGKGVRLLDLRYLGIGQHVTLSDMERYKSVAEVIDALRAQMAPPTDPNKNPLTGQSQLVFAADSQWLIGLDLTVLEFVRIGIVFNDPTLYGLVVALTGPGAKKLNGLSFELLYKKVTDDIGVFRVRIQVPEAFRQIELGAASITLGIITVDIFTNGNFRVDLGFPENRNFEVSFGFEIGPFIGRGGIYFALLNGATSRRVPAITNGTFSPVIELGVGVAAGLGRTFNKGPLSAGLYVEIEAIFIGVLAWFHPSDAAQDTSMYYWCRGTVAIAGKVYGKVDFKIISVSVSIKAYASVSLTLESYMPAIVELDVGVEVDAEVDLFFFTISFSFHMNLQASFTIGEAQATPWILAADQSGRDPHRLVMNIAVPRRRRPRDIVALTHAAFLAQQQTAGVTVWNPDITLFADGKPVAVRLTLLPALPIADVPVAWTTMPPPPEPAYWVAFMLTAAVPGTQDQNKDVSFNNLVQIATRWSLTSIGLAPFASIVTPGVLAELKSVLAGTAASNDGFTYSNLDTLLGKNLRLQIDGRPATPDPAASGVAFPMIPALGWADANLPDPADKTRRFDSYGPVDGTYEQELRSYLDKLLPGTQLPPPAGGAGTESMATFVFRDYMLLLAKAAVEEAIQLMANWPLPVTNRDQSLADIARSFATADVTHVKADGDNVDEVAAAFGLSAGELEFLNPGIVNTIRSAASGTVLTLKIGITPQSIAAANTGIALRAGSWPLGDLPYQIRDGDTLGAIATLYHLTLKDWLNWRAKPDAPADMLTDVRLLAAGRSLPVGARYVYQNTAALPVDQLSGVFFVRLFGPDDVVLLDWYAQAIVTLNPGLEINQDGNAGTLPNPLKVPRAYQALDNPINWAPLAGDTLRDVAAYFALIQNVVAGSRFDTFRVAMQGRNPGPDLSRILLPLDAVTRVLPAETLGRLCTRLLLDPQGDVFVAIVTDAVILQSLVTVTVRGAIAAVEEGTTLAALGLRYAIAVEELGGRLSQKAILSKAGSLTLDIVHLVSMTIDEILVEILGGPMATRISNQVSRFMLHGLRIPAPHLDANRYHPTGPLTSLYVLTGQEVKGKAPTLTEDPAPVLSATFNVPGAQKAWIHLGTDTTPGSSGSLLVGVSNEDLRNYAPDTVLAPEFDQPPEASQLWLDQPMRWDLPQHIVWQTPASVALPGAADTNATGSMPGLWPLPDALLARAGKLTKVDQDNKDETDDAPTYQLRTIDSSGGASPLVRDVKSWAFACMIDFTVRRIAGRPGLFEVFGSDTAARQVLLRAWTSKPDDTGAPEVRLLYRPSAATGLAGGLVSPTLGNVDGAYLIKVNLSTETHSGMRAVRALFLADSEPAVVAPITDAKDFLMLLWECSVVGGGGYWMQASAPDGSPALPDSIFGSDGQATLSVLITVDKQIKAPPLRTLLSFNNCAIVGDAIDLSAVHLVAETDDAAAKVRLPAVQPGNVGFDFTLLRPPPPDKTNPRADAANRTRRYYQLAGYRLLPTEAFAGAAPSVPIGPQKTPPATKGGRDRWSLTQVIPAARFALSHPLPDLDGLPKAEFDPYAGIRLFARDSVKALGAVRVELWFQDMLGNATEGAPTDPAVPTTPGPTPIPSGQLNVPVGYTDPVIGISNWPAVATAFSVTKGTVVATARLSVALDFQCGTYLQGAADPPGAAAKAASDHRERYALIYYQLMQDHVESNLLTSLNTDHSAERKPVRLAGQLGGLRSFATAAYAFLDTASKLTGALSAVACRTVNDVIARHGVWFDGLAIANANVKLSAIFADQSGTKITLPRFVLFRQGDAVSALSVDPAALLKDKQNTVLPLRVGVELAIPARPAQTPAAPTTIATLATREKCAVAALVKANVGSKNLLTVGFKFVFEGATVEVGVADTTLEDVARTFRDKAGVPVDALTLGTTYADVSGVWAMNSTFQVASYTATQGDSFAVNGSGADIAALAQQNVNTPDLFVAGTPLFTQAVDGSSVFQRGLAEAAKAFGITGEQLLAFNAATPFAANAVLGLPGQTLLTQAQKDVRIPCGIASGDMLNVIATRFFALDQTDPVQALAAANATLPGVMAGGQTVRIGEHVVTTQAGDSLQAVAARFDPVVPVTQVVDAIRATTGYLAEGGILLCPPAQAAKATTPSLSSVAALFGLDPLQLALANASQVGILQPNKTFTVTREDPDTHEKKRYSVTTAADPEHPGGPSPFALTSIIAGLAMQHVEATLADVVAENKDLDVLVAGALLLLPPPKRVLGADLGTNPAQFPGPIFPVHSWVEIRRTESELILPGFKGTADNPSPAEACISPVAPRGRGNGATGEFQAALTLKEFASDLEQAFAMLRVCTGKVLTTTGRGTDVWAIGFGPTLIEKVSVHPPATTAPAPQFFALRPLFNHLVSRQAVSISPLNADGTLGATVPTDFQGIDVETWASDFLTDVELFLSAANAVPAYRGAARGNLQRVIRSKALLADAVADGVDYVLDLGQGVPVTRPKDWQSAHDFLQQQLLTSLGQAWNTDVLLQYGTEVTVSPPLRARLSGAAIKANTALGADGNRVGIAGAKIDLAQANSFATFGVTLQKSGDAAQAAGEPTQSYLSLDLSFGINEVEFNVRPVEQGYEASDWLSFIRPPDAVLPPPGWSVSLGPNRAPLPLRSYPAPAVLLAQGARPTYPATSDWQQSAVWTYAFTYQHASAAQDQIRFDVVFNERNSIQARALDETEDLFAVLAQYASVRRALWDILKALPAVAAVVPDTPLANAVATFAGLVERARTTWKAHWKIPPLHWTRMALPAGANTLAADTGATLPQLETYRYVVSSNSAKISSGVSRYVSFTLERDAASTGPVGWPDIQVTPFGGPMFRLTRGEPAGGRCTYAFPSEPAVPVGTQLDVEIAFAGLHLAKYQKATAAVAVIRNARLLGVDGSKTRDGFVFMTPPVSFPDKVVPLLAWEVFDIGTWTPDGARLAAVMNGVLGGDASGDRPVSLAIQYGYELVPTANLRTRLPIGMRPTAGYTSADITAVAQLLTQWQADNRPSMVNAEWVFSLTAYSAIDPGAHRPILELRQLLSPLVGG